MDVPSLLISALLFLAILGIAYARRGREGVGEGFSKSWDLFFRAGPNLVFGLLIAGFFSALLSEKLAAAWMGEGSGAKGLCVGTLAGVLTPGGPFTHFPILAALAQKGAGVGPLTAYIAAWSLLGLHRILIWEAPFLGWRFVVARVTASIFFPPIMGWLAQAISYGQLSHPALRQ